MRAYTANDIQQIINVAFERGWQTARSIHRDAPMPDPPSLHEIVDHPYHSSNAPGQYRKPWLYDTRGQRGQVVTAKEVKRETQDSGASE